MAQENDAADGQPEPQKSRKWLLIGLVCLVLLTGGGTAAYFLLAGGSDKAPAAEQAEPKQAQALYTKIRTRQGKPMFVVTLVSSDGRRHYLQAYVEAKSRNQKVVDTLNKHMPRVVSLLNALFSTQKFEDLRTAEGKRELKKEATQRVQQLMQEKIGEPGVETLLFTNFVMQ